MGNCLATPDVKDEKSASGALAALSGADGGGKDENGEVRERAAKGFHLKRACKMHRLYTQT